MLMSLFKPRPAKTAGRALYAAAAAQARNPEFYRSLGAPDRIDSRFEVYTLHVALLLERLLGNGEEADETAQATLEAFVTALDEVLRDVGVGDLSMSKKMKKLAGLIMGRIAGVRDALSAPDPAALETLLMRSVFAEAGPEARPAAMADYALRAHAALAAQPLREVLQARPAWPEVIP